MKKELKNILKYLVVYGILLVTPAVLLAFVEVVADRMRGGTMNSAEVWNSPFMTSALLLGSLLIIAVFLWRRWATIGLGRIRRADVWSVVHKTAYGEGVIRTPRGVLITRRII